MNSGECQWDTAGFCNNKSHNHSSMPIADSRDNTHDNPPFIEPRLHPAMRQDNGGLLMLLIIQTMLLLVVIMVTAAALMFR